MGRRVSKSGQINKARSLILCALERQKEVNDTIRSLEVFANDISLSGNAYANAKGYVRNILIPTNKALCMALKDEITANKNVINCCNTYLNDVDFLDEDTLLNEIERLEWANRELRNDWWEYLPVVCEINSVRIMRNNSKIRQLRRQIEKLENYDNATKGLHGDATSQMGMIKQKISSIFSKPLFVNGHYNYGGISMSWANCFVKRWDDNRTAINREHEIFTLPKEQRDEVERIINSDATWEEKAEQVRRVYERYLFENVTDIDGDNPFLNYAVMHKQNIENMEDFDMDVVEKKLGIILQNSGIDIRSVIRTLSEDLLRTMPQNVSSANKMLNFINLVKPDAPADLKNKALTKSIGVEDSGKYNFDFSIWSRRWESGMSVDYLGNYGFGYIGAGYWQGVDFDNVVGSVSLMRAVTPSVTGDNFIAGGRLYVEGIVSVSALRIFNPDKTDAEMFCRLGAGVAQLKSDDFDVSKYVKNVLNGNWGDNVGDSEMIGDGFNDYYGAHGIDKAQVIKEERKLW